MLSVGDLIDPIGFWLYIKRAPGQVVSWQKKKKKKIPICLHERRAAESPRFDHFAQLCGLWKILWSGDK